MSKLEKATQKQFKNIALAGGGICGLSYTTAFKAMNNLDKMKYIEKVIGVSIGSLMGVLVACKCTNKEIDDYTVQFWKELTNLPESTFQQALNFYEKLGLHDNKNIYNVVDKLLHEKYGKHKMTLKQFYEKSGVEFTTVVTNLTTRKANYMNYITQPDLEVAEAVKMSTAIPFFFVQVKWHDVDFCDGGAMDNFPIDYYDFMSGEFNDKTIGFHFQSTDCDTTTYKNDSVLKIMESLEDAEITNNEIQSIQQYDKRFIIEIDTGKIGSIDFNITEAQKQFLLMSGYNSTIKFFAKYDEKIKEQIKNRTWLQYIWSYIH
jgi:predicted acylesterase/phospholipase RssA